MSDTTIATLSTDWAVESTSKAGKITRRSAVGVMLHGTTAQVRMLGNDVLAGLLAANNFRHALAELSHEKLFPAKSLRKAPGLTIDKEGQVHLSHQIDADTLQLVRLNPDNPNKTAMRAYAAAVVWLMESKEEAGTPLKGVKLAAAQTCQSWLHAMERVDALKASQAQEAIAA